MSQFFSSCKPSMCGGLGCAVTSITVTKKDFQSHDNQIPEKIQMFLKVIHNYCKLSTVTSSYSFSSTCKSCSNLAQE